MSPSCEYLMSVTGFELSQSGACNCFDWCRMTALTG